MTAENLNSKTEQENQHEQLAQSLRSEGLSGATSQRLLKEYWDKAESLNDSERWQANLRLAEIFHTAGLFQGAIIEYETIYADAYYAQKDDIAQECDRRVDVIVAELLVDQDVGRGDTNS